MAELDMFNRDPNSINGHLGVKFEDILGEPEGIHSIDCVWSLSYKCFECWKGLCYKLMTLFYGICIAMEWGCEFAYVAFYHIWIITPAMKWIEMNCAVCQKLYTLCINCCCQPICEAFGGIFVNFKK